MILRPEVTAIQEEALTAWEKANKWGTVILSTGVGKSWLGVMAYQKIGNSPKTLVITSKHPILEQWKNLFSETLGIVNNIDYLCIQSAYKRLGEYDFIIIDEVHRALSPKHRAVFAGLKAKYMMCLTATLPEDEAYINFLGEKCPVIYAKHLLDVVKQGILPEFKIYNLEVELHKSLTGKYKVFNNSFTSALIHLEKLRSQSPLLQFKYRNIFELANTEQRGSDPILKKLSQQYWMSMQMRKLVLYDNITKLSVTKDIITRFGAERKWLLLTKSIKFANLLQETVGGRVYHSKLKKDERSKILEDFKEGAFNLLIGVDALTEGVNLPDLDGAICLSGVSTELSNLQSLGRVLRFKEGKRNPVYINLYTKDTVERNWVETKTDKSGLKSVTTWVTNINQIPN